MSSGVYKRNAIGSSRIRISAESELEDAALEERLQNLLDGSNKQDRRTRNLFHNVQQAPKLRRSVVVRAVENVVSSTPMPAERTRKFFCTDYSLNISPIDPISEDVEQNCDNEKENKAEEEKLKEARVILTPLPIPIVISSESEDEEIQNIIKETEGHKDGIGIHHNFRGGSQLIGKQEKSGNSKTDRGVATSEAVNDSLSRNITFRNKSSSTILSNKKNQSSRKPDRSVVQNESPEKSPPAQVASESIRTRSRQRNETNKSTTSVKSIPHKSPRSNNASKSKIEDDGPLANSNVTKRTLRSSKHIEDGKDDGQDTEQSPRKRRGIDFSENKKTVLDIYQSVRHISFQEIEKLLMENNTEQNEANGINNSKSKTAEPSPQQNIQNRNASANKSGVNETASLCKRNPNFRKLSFASTSESDSNKMQTPDTKMEQPKISKIPISKSRSKSRERNVETASSSKKFVDLQEEKTDSSSESHSSKENYYQRKQLPPKRPPRRRKVPKKLNSPMITHNSRDSGCRDHETNQSVPEKENNKVDKSDKAISACLETVKDKSCVKTAEIGTSPLILPSNEIVSMGAETTDAVTSFNKVQSRPSSVKANRLSKLISKLEEHRRGSSTLKDLHSTSGQHSRVSHMRDFSTMRRQMPMISREVQTSIPRNDSKNSNSTEASDIIDGFEKEMRPHILFETLGDDILNFTSDEEDLPEITPQTSLERRPWRVDEDLDIFPRRSSCKLNFLRSAQEIELEKSRPLEERGDYRRGNTVQMYSSRYRSDKKSVAQTISTRVSRSSMSDLVVNESNSDSELELDEARRRTASNVGNSQKKQNNSEGTVKDTTLRDVTQRKAEGSKLNASNRSQNNDSTLKDPVQCDAGAEFNMSNHVRGDSSSTRPRNSHLQIREETDINKSLKGLGFVEMRCENKDAIDSGAVTSTVNKVTENLTAEEEILAVPLEDSQPEVVEEPPVEVNLRRSTRHSKSSNRADTTHKSTKSRSISVPAAEKSMNSSQSAINSVPSVENTLKTPPSAIPPVPYKKNVTKTPANAISSVSDEEEILKTPPSVITPAKSNNNENSNKKYPPQKKGTKKKGPKPRAKKVIPEKDDDVSSTTGESEDGGIRRSKRDRKVVQRRCYGTILTHSKRVYQYFNGVSTSSETESKSTKPKKKKENSSDTTSDDQVFKKPEVKKSTVKKMTQPRKSTKNAPSESVTDTPHSPLQSNNPDSSQTEKSRTRRPSKNPPETPKDILPNKRTKTKNNTSVNKSNRDKTSERPTNNDSCNSDNAVNLNIQETPVEETETNGNDIRSGIGKEVSNSFHFGKESIEDDCGFYSDVPQDNLNSVGDVSNANKDSGRSTMLRSCLLEKTRVGKPLTGRVNKNYKKIDIDVTTKISKVLSKSLNTSQEREIVSEKDGKSRWSKAMSIVESTLEDSEFIVLSSEGSVVKMKYIEQTPSFKVVKDNLMVADGLRNTKDGGAMGYLKLPPSGHKPLHIARRFALLYFVISGEGLIQVHNVTSKVMEHSTFIIPLGVEYSIHNTSKEKWMLLGFVKMTSSHGS